MVSLLILQKYISKCDEVIAENSQPKAHELVREIVNVFQSDFEGIKSGLATYSFSFGNNTTNYIKDISLLRARLEKELYSINPESRENSVSDERPKKVFISHANVDKDFIVILVDLLESIGLRKGDIVCTSVPPYCVPLDNNVYNWLVNEFVNSDLHVFFVLSHNYYKSPACLNEMGAAWAMKNEWTGILLPGFDFSEISGCIDSGQISIKLDVADKSLLNHRLGELKDKLIDEFGLESLDPDYWERKRDDFLDRLNRVPLIRDVNQVSNESSSSILDDCHLSKDEAILLVYASDDPKGEISLSRDITRTNLSIEVNGYELNRDDSAREAAKWKAVVEKLERLKLVESVGVAGLRYKVTYKGYTLAEKKKTEMEIDTDKSPDEYWINEE